LQLDLKTQRAKVNRDYREYLSKRRLSTAGGLQELLCIEWEALAMWLANIQDQRTTHRDARRRLRAFRARVMAAASAILSGQAKDVPLEGPLRRASNYG
jgi:hypothetical protein